MTHLNDAGIVDTQPRQTRKNRATPMTQQSLPKQEPVEKWQDSFYKKFCVKGDYYYWNDDKSARKQAEMIPDVLDFISHQKALSRAEGYREAIDILKREAEIAKQDVEMADDPKDPRVRLNYFIQLLEGLSDTLAVVDEIKSKEVK